LEWVGEVKMAGKSYRINVVHQIPDLKTFTQALQGLIKNGQKELLQAAPNTNPQVSNLVKETNALAIGYKDVSLALGRATAGAREAAAKALSLKQESNILGANLVGIIMSFLGAAFTFGYLAQNLSYKLSQFDSLAEASKRLAAISNNIRPEEYAILENKLKDVAEKLNVDYWVIGQIGKQVAFASDSLGDAFERIRLTSAIMQATGLSWSQAAKMVTGMMEGDMRSIKQLRRYLGMEEGGTVDPAKMWQRMNQAILAQETQTESVINRIQIKLNSLWAGVDDTLDGISLAFYVAMERVTDALFGSSQAANMFQKSLRDAFSGLGAGLVILSQGVSKIGQFGLAVFGLVELGKVLGQLSVAARAAVASIAGAAGLSTGIAGLGIAGLVVGGLFLLGKAIKKLGDWADSTAKRIQATQAAASLWLSSIIGNSQNIDEALKRIGEATVEGIQTMIKDITVGQQTAIGTLTGLGNERAAVIQIPKTFKIAELPEWQDVIGAVKKYEEEFQRLGYISSETAENTMKVINDSIDKIVKAYKLSEESKTKLETLKKYIYQFLSTWTQLNKAAETANETSDAAKELEKVKRNVFNVISTLIDINSAVAKYTGNSRMVAYWQTFQKTLNYLRSLYSEEGQKSLQMLKQIAPSLYKQLAPTKNKIITVMKGMYLDTIHYWDKIKISFNGGLKSLNEAVQNQITKLIRGSISGMPDFNKMYEGAKGVVTQLEADPVVTQLQTTNKYLKEIKDTVSEMKSGKTTLQQQIDVFVQNIEKGAEHLFGKVFGTFLGGS